MEFCEFIKGIDFFGKEPEFYIKGRPKQVTFIGRFFHNNFYNNIRNNFLL